MKHHCSVKIAQGLFVLTLMSLGHTASAQSVAIAPQVIVVDAKTNSGAITLVNQGDDPTEVSLSTEYGYPATDSSGTMFLRTFPSADDTMPSAAPWIQIFPQRLHLAAHARRTIRILVTPPTQHPLAAREYWARLVVAARGASRSIQGRGDTAAIHVGLSLEVRSVLPFFYRHGPVTTGVQLDAARAVVQGDSLVARVRLTRTGTAAFVGSVNAALQDARGKAVATGMLPLGVYYTLTPRVPIAIRGLPRGNYTLVLTAVGSRPDVSAEALVPAATVRTTLPVTLQ